MLQVRRIPAGLAFAALVLAGASLGAAEGGGAPAVVAMLAAEDQRPVADEVVFAVRAHLSDIEARLDVVWVPVLPPDLPGQAKIVSEVAAARGAFAVFWFDLARPGEAYFYVTSGNTDDLLVHRLAADSASDMPEALGIVVHGAIAALLAGGTIGVAPVTAAPQPAPPLPAPPPPPPSTQPMKTEKSSEGPGSNAVLRLDIGYALDGYSNEVAVTQGAALGLSVEVGAHVVLSARYTFVWPVEVRGRAVDTEIQRYPFEIGGMYRRLLGRFLVGGGLAFRLDYTVAETMEVHLSGVEGRDNADAVISLVPGIEVGFALHPRVALFLDIGARIIWNSLRYVATWDQGREVVLEPWRVQPAGVIGLSVGLL